MNQANLHHSASYLKAIEVESQLLNISMFNHKAAEALCDMDEGEFLKVEHKEIRRAILGVVTEDRKVSVTAIANRISPEIKRYFLNLVVAQHYGDFGTLYSQYTKFKKMAEAVSPIQHMLTYASAGEEELFTETVETFIDNHYSSSVVDDAQSMANLMVKTQKEMAEQVLRIKNPIPSLAKIVPEFRGGQYVCIAGSPGMGKTTASLLIAERTPNSLFISYEMDTEELHDIIISRYTGIDSKLITTDNLNFDQAKKISAAKRMLQGSLTLRVCDQHLMARDLFPYIRRMTRKYNLQCVVIDYAQIIPGLNTKGTQTNAYEELSRKFKQVARQEKILIIALSQINKDSMNNGRAPGLQDLRGSLSFGSDADTVIFFYGTPGENLGEEIPCCSVAKQRKGSVGKVHGFKYIKKIHWME